MPSVCSSPAYRANGRQISGSAMIVPPSSPSANLKLNRRAREKSSPIRKEVIDEAIGCEDTIPSTQEVMDQSASMSASIDSESSTSSINTISYSSASDQSYSSSQEEEEAEEANEFSSMDIATTDADCEWIMTVKSSNSVLLPSEEMMDCDDSCSTNFRPPQTTSSSASTLATAEERNRKPSGSVFYKNLLLEIGGFGSSEDDVGASNRGSSSSSSSSSSNGPNSSMSLELGAEVTTTLSSDLIRKFGTSKRGPGDMCPLCSSPLVFTAFGDAVYCKRVGCSPHRYAICETTLESLPFGEGDQYFVTTTKTANHGHKIESLILGRSTKGSAALGIATQKTAVVAAPQQTSSSGNPSNVVAATDDRVYLREGVLSYMRMCIIQSRMNYSKMMGLNGGCGSTSALLSSSTPSYASSKPIETSASGFMIPSTSLLAGLLAVCTAAQNNAQTIRGAAYYYLTVLLCSSTSPGKDNNIADGIKLSSLPEYSFVSYAKKFQFQVSTASKRLANNFFIHAQIPGFSFQPVIIDPNEPISIQEICAFAKSHEYGIIHSQKLTEVYCALTGQVMPEPNAVLQNRTRMVYDQMRSYFTQKLSPVGKIKKKQKKESASSSGASSKMTDFLSSIIKFSFSNKDSCDSDDEEHQHQEGEEDVYDEDLDDDSDDEEEDDDGDEARNNMVWDYKYMWFRMYHMFDIGYMTQFVPFTVKIGKFVKLENTFHMLCRHLNYKYEPLQFPWQPGVSPVPPHLLQKLSKYAAEIQLGSKKFAGVHPQSKQAVVYGLQHFKPETAAAVVVTVQQDTPPQDQVIMPSDANLRDALSLQSATTISPPLKVRMDRETLKTVGGVNFIGADEYQRRLARSLEKVAVPLR